MTLPGICGVALLVGTTSALLPAKEGPLRRLVGVSGGILLLGWAVERLTRLLSLFSSLPAALSLGPYTALLLKGVGVGYVVKLGGDICRDLGASETASRLEMCGKMEILLLSMEPIFELISLAMSLIGEGI